MSKKNVSILGITLLLIVTISCGNVAMVNTPLDSTSLGFQVILPGTQARSAYFTADDAGSYLIQILQAENEIVSKRGLPGETVQLLLTEAGTYTVKVTALDIHSNIIAVGSVTETLTYGAGIVPLVIHLNPNKKEIKIAVSIIWDTPVDDDTPVEYDTPVESCLKLTLKGDDADLFKLRYHDEQNQYTVTTFPAEIISYIAKDTFLLCDAFIDENNNNTYDENEIRVGSWFKMNPGCTVEEEIDIVKTTINFTLSGNTSAYSHPKIINNLRGSGSSSKVITTIDSGYITVYGNKNGHHGYSAFLSAFEDVDDDGVFNYGKDYLISTETRVSVEDGENEATITLFDEPPVILADGEKIDFRYYDTFDSFTEEERKHYRFFKENENDKYISFYIPTGDGTDGSFITCYDCENGKIAEYHSGDHYWYLLNLVYADNTEMMNRCSDNYSYQFAELLQNMKDIVAYLETEKGFTVYGKELIEE